MSLTGGHSVSRPSLPKVADFLLWLRRSKGLSVSSILGYRSMLSAIFLSILPAISSDPVIKDHLRSLKVEAPPRPLRPPAWDLSVVMRYLVSSSFELLSQSSLQSLTKNSFYWPWLLLSTLGNSRLCLPRCCLFAQMLVFLMFRSLWPKRSPCPIPFLTPF